MIVADKSTDTYYVGLATAPKIATVFIGLPAPKSSDCGLWVRASRR